MEVERVTRYSASVVVTAYSVLIVPWVSVRPFLCRSVTTINFFSSSYIEETSGWGSERSLHSNVGLGGKPESRHAAHA